MFGSDPEIAEQEFYAYKYDMAYSSEGDMPLYIEQLLAAPTPQKIDVQAALDLGVLYRMLEKERGQRIPSVRLVGAELEEILEATRYPSSVALSEWRRHSSPPTRSMRWKPSRAMPSTIC